MRNNYFFLLVFTIGFVFAAVIPGKAQMEDELLISLELGPTFSWLPTNSNLIDGAGSNLGFRFTILAEKYFGQNYAFTFGAGMSFGQGGKLRYKRAGNFLPNSDLSDPKANEGEQPMPEGTEIDYHLGYIELQGGLRLYTNRINYFKYFLDLPMARMAFNTRARADIKATGIDLEKETVGPDINPFNFSWGVGAGAQGVLQNDMEVYGGITYFQSFSRVIKKDGFFSTLIDDGGTPGDPEDDVYERQRIDEKSKLASLTIRVGLIF